MKHPLNNRVILLLVEGLASILSFTLSPILNRLFPSGLCICPERKPGEVHVRGGRHIERDPKE